MCPSCSPLISHPPYISVLGQWGRRPGCRLSNTRAPLPAALRRRVAVQAKYGEESRFFDLKDLENTLGSWDM
jgi:hypothetical protein